MILHGQDQVEFTGRSALAIAADRGNAEAVRFLLDANTWWTY
jgi:ankyrin repeat protein